MWNAGKVEKQHYANIFEIEDETLAKAAKLAKKIMTHEKDVLGFRD